MQKLIVELIIWITIALIWASVIKIPAMFNFITSLVKLRWGWVIVILLVIILIINSFYRFNVKRKPEMLAKRK